MRKPVLLLAALAAGPLAAQTTTQQGAPAQPASVQPVTAPPERRPLILELDETSRRQILSGSRSAETGGRGDALPSLGGDAKPVDPSSVRSSRSPFPNQSDGGPTNTR